MSIDSLPDIQLNSSPFEFNISIPLPSASIFSENIISSPFSSSPLRISVAPGSSSPSTISLLLI